MQRILSFAVSVPSSPHIMRVLSRNCTSVTIKWVAPEQRNGKLLGYQLNISYDEERTSVNITDGRTNTYQITGLCKMLYCRQFLLCLNHSFVFNLM